MMSDPKMVKSVYQGTPKTKFVCWAIDRKDGEIKLFYMAKTILEAVSALEETPDYALAALPMPYDITVNAKGAGTKEVVYSVFPMPPSAVTKEEFEEFKAKKPIDEVVARLLENQSVNEVQTGEQTTHVKEHVDTPPALTTPPPTPDRLHTRPA